MKLRAESEQHHRGEQGLDGVGPPLLRAELSEKEHGNRQCGGSQNVAALDSDFLRVTLGDGLAVLAFLDLLDRVADLGDRLLEGLDVDIRAHLGPRFMAGVVDDGILDAFLLPQDAFDPERTGSARHPFDIEDDRLNGGLAHFPPPLSTRSSDSHPATA